MAHLQLAWGFALTLLLFIQGCHSQRAQCGVAPSNTRIVGGQDAVADSWPWQAIVYVENESFCGGSLISEQWVLTAAHCITSDQVDRAQVFLGINDLSASNPNQVTQNLDEVICHPDYDEFTFDNDICLLKLSEPVSVTPVCLPGRASTFHSGLSCWVTGFGTIEEDGEQPDVLQEVNVPIVGHNRCECYNPFDVTDNMICAGLAEGGKDSCQGDSGGPMVTKMANNSWLQVGVVSFGIGCARPHRPGVYALVSRYEAWIKSEVGDDEVGFVTFKSPGPDPDDGFVCPTPMSTTTSWPYTTDSPDPTDDSVFGGADALTRFAHFFAASAFGLLLHLLVGAV